MTEQKEPQFERIDENKSRLYEKEQSEKEIERLSEENRNIKILNESLKKQINKLKNLTK